MIKSMTGYGRQESVLEGKKILAEVRSVNHRFSDYSIKLPRNMLFLEDRVRCLASEYITRGKVDIYIAVENFEEGDKEIILNEPIARSYLNALYKLRDTFNLKDDITVSRVAMFGDVFRAERREEDEQKIWYEIEGVLKQALEKFVDMRSREGERIYKDLYERIEYMQSLAKNIEKREPGIVADYKNRLYEKIKETLGDCNIDEGRILTEVAIFADRVAINEEIVRLSSHFEEYFSILNGNEPAGRKLDFLIQEINREVNTIGSKASDITVSKKVVELKSEIEKLREQIQNVE